MIICFYLLISAFGKQVTRYPLKMARRDFFPLDNFSVCFFIDELFFPNIFLFVRIYHMSNHESCNVLMLLVYLFPSPLLEVPVEN